MWLYGAGFPKSMNVGKQLEKRLEDEKTKQKTEYDLRLMWERDLQKTKRNEKKQDEILQSQLQEQSLQGTMYGEKSKESNLWREEPCLEGWNNIQKTERELQRCKVCEMSKRVFINGEERWICNGTQTCDGKTFREMLEQSGSCPSYRPQSEQQQNRKLNAIQEQCRTQESREVIEYWNKFGTALKPSFEPIIVTRKPFKGTLVDNVIEYGVGGINIDECRVGTEERTYKGMSKHKPEGAGTFRDDNWEPKDIEVSVNGRFPANTILTYDETDFDEVCGGFPNTKTGTVKVGNTHSKGLFGSGKTFIPSQTNGGDSGSASRYFYCAKASKKDRDEGCQDLEDTFNACSNQAIAEQKRGNNNFADEKNSTFNKVYVGKNTHPTVKPTELMQYLVRLVSPNNAIILDPFNGSGSTGKAVMYENLEKNKNYKYIGIELTEEYLPIAKARIDYVCNLSNNNEEKKENKNVKDLLNIEQYSFEDLNF